MLRPKGFIKPLGHQDLNLGSRIQRPLPSPDLAMAHRTVTGLPGFEPGITESEPAALTELGYNPISILLVKIIYFLPLYSS